MVSFLQTIEFFCNDCMNHYHYLFCTKDSILSFRGCYIRTFIFYSHYFQAILLQY